MLRLDKQDEIRFTTCADRDAVLTRATLANSDDPVMSQFLNFLANNMALPLERLTFIDAGLIQCIRVSSEFETCLS